ncbi:MAG: hypothetical protein ACRCZF_03760, partial [Gemmataceae bacterium]
ARTANLSGEFIVQNGSANAWAKDNITGRFTALHELVVCAGGEIDAALTSLDEGVQVNVSKSISGSIRALNWVKVNAGWSVHSSIDCGDIAENYYGSVTVDAGVDITGHVKTSGSARLRAGENIKGGAEATRGWIDANGGLSIRGHFVAGEEVYLATRGYTAASVRAWSFVRVHAFGDIRKTYRGITSVRDRVAINTGAILSQDILALDNIRIQAGRGIVNTTAQSVSGDVWVVSNGPISGSFTGRYVADVRTTLVGAEVTGTVRATAKGTNKRGAWAKKTAIINEQLAELAANNQEDSDTAQKLRLIRQLLGLQPPPPMTNNTPPADLEPSQLQLD